MTSTRSFICQAKTEEDKKTWLNMLQEVHHDIKKRITITQEVKALPECLNQKILKEWTIEDVSLWLYCNEFDMLVDGFKRSSIQGERLKNITENNIKTDFGIKDPGKSLSIYSKIQAFCSQRKEMEEKAMENTEHGDEEEEDKRPRFINIQEVKFSSFEKEEIKKLTFVVQISWINSQNQTRKEKKLSKKYEDFEKFEKTREKLLPNSNIKLIDRKHFLESLEKKQSLEKYLQGN